MKRFGTAILALLLVAIATSCIGPTPPPDTARSSARAPSAKPTAEELRLEAWRSLVETQQGADLAQKLMIVNAFFNALHYAPDSEQWQVEDYWATPAELLRRNAGDCEDFVIGKYFTLRALNVPDERLRLTYVIAGQPARAHMVLAYYESPGAEPLVLDSLQPEIRRASLRADLAPVFGFNGGSLWVGGALQSAVSDPSVRLSNWRGMLARMPGDPLIASI